MAITVFGFRFFLTRGVYISPKAFEWIMAKGLGNAFTSMIRPSKDLELVVKMAFSRLLQRLQKDLNGLSKGL